MRLTIGVVLGQSHPAIGQNIESITRQIGEILTSSTGASGEQDRNQLADQFGLPRNVPFRLVVRAIRPGGGAA
jgi:hypothetical protein